MSIVNDSIKTNVQVDFPSEKRFVLFIMHLQTGMLVFMNFSTIIFYIDNGNVRLCFPSFNANLRY